MLLFVVFEGTFRLEIDSKEMEAALSAQFLSIREQAVYFQLSGMQRKRSFAAGRLAAKRCLQSFLRDEGLSSISLSELEILRNPDGSLFVSVAEKRRLDLFVSISHGGAFAFVGFCKNRFIGVDVEPLGPRCVIFKDEFSAPEEVEILLSARDAKNIELEFVRLFSAKEAAAKCLGTHMYYAFHHYRLIEAGRDTLIFRELSGRKLRFVVDSTFEEGHVFSRMVDSDIHIEEGNLL